MFALILMIFSVFSLTAHAIDVPKAPVIKSAYLNKAKSTNEKSSFKLYLENYNPDYIKVKRANNQFKTKVYIFEEDSIMMQPDTINYWVEPELFTSQSIDLGKKYYAQVEFISYDKYDNKVVDSKMSEKVEIKLQTDVKSEDTKAKAFTEQKDESKVYIKAPKILSAFAKGRKLEMRLDDYNQTYAEIKNNSTFLGEVTVYERELNRVKLVMNTEFNDYSMDREFMLPEELSSNNEYVVIVRFASVQDGKKLYGPTSNEVIIKEKLNTQRYQQKYKPIHLATENKTYLFPNEAGLIEPERPITRGEVALAFFSLLSERAKSDNYAKNHLFVDSIPSKYSEAISTMAKMRVINGYEDNTFKASNPITRAEFITIAMKFYEDVPVKHTQFSDVPNNFWAKPSIEKALSVGLMKGYADASFKPNNPITRAEVATVINRMSGKVGMESKYKNKFLDNDPTKWYYEEIKAAN